MNKSTITPWSWIRLRSHRSLAKGGWYQFALYAIVVLFLLVILALVFDLTKQGQIIDKYEGANGFDNAFYHLFTNGGENKLGGSYGWLVTIIGVVLVAVLTSLFTNFFERVAQQYLEGKTHYKVRNHVAVFGYHDMLPGLLKQLFSEEGEGRYFLVQTTKVEKARNELSRVLSEKQMRCVILQEGELSSPLDMAFMHVDAAGEIFILGEEMRLGADSAHDTAVLQCLRNIKEYLPVPKDDKGKILCHVLFEHQTTFAVFQHTDLSNTILEKMAFLPFNYYEMWARKVLVNDSLTPAVSAAHPYLPLEGTSGIDKDSEDCVHLVVVGMSRMGVAMGLEAAHLAHYPNFIGHPERKTRITFIDRKAREEMYHLQGRMEAMFQTASWRFISPEPEEYGYSKADVDQTPWHRPLTDRNSKSPYKSAAKHLGTDVVDVEWEFIQADDENPAVQEYLRSRAADKHTRLTVAVCVPDSHKAIAIGLNLPPAVIESAIQVLIYQRTGDSIVQALSTGAVAGHAALEKIHPFGMSFGSYDLPLVNKLAYIACNLNTGGEPTLRDMLVADARRKLDKVKASSSKSAAANMWSTVYNAAHLWTKLRSVHSVDGAIPAEELPVLAQTEHIRWNVEQLLTQFRPLTEKEQKAFPDKKSDGAAFSRMKDEFKREKLSHLDIVSCDRLEKVDPGIFSEDIRFVEIIPDIYRRLQQLK